MKELFKKLPNYEDIKDLHLFDGAIANKNRVYLLAREFKEDAVDSKVKKKVLVYQRDLEPAHQLTIIATLTKYVFPQCGISYEPVEQLVIYDSSGNRHSYDGLKLADEYNEDHVSPKKSRTIGSNLYVATSLREVFFRNIKGEFTELGSGQTYRNYSTYDKPLDKDGEIDIFAVTSQDGFNDVDGFNENHIYAVGGHGDVWRYIDGLWTQCGFPTNLDLENVCCGEDGLVYISGLEGMTYVGIEDNWKVLKNPELSLPFKDVAWYDGKVWATNDYGTWWITSNGIMDANIPDEVKVCSGRLHANAGMLLIVGLGGAALLENGEWQLLFSYSEFIP